ncbi:MAG TPA: hypothetical protein VGQ00_01460 [Candidatus Norongarragalinales archaeon]|jgi:large subunit ribosomal protein L34e|nr:hypothetical protein [Candidatus Norongarragalinales archaeon]
MPQPRFRSNSKKARQRRSPGGASILIYKAKKPGKATCAICFSKLNAVPNLRKAEIRALSKTQKRPERVFGGVLCFDCTGDVLKAKTRLASGSIKREDVDLKLLKYVDQLKKK